MNIARTMARPIQVNKRLGKRVQCVRKHNQENFEKSKVDGIANMHQGEQGSEFKISK